MGEGNRHYRRMTMSGKGVKQGGGGIKAISTMNERKKEMIHTNE